MQASDEFEMNEWINLINYASAFKTADIRMRGTAINKDQALLAGAAAAASHQRDVRRNGRSSDDNPSRKAVFGDITVNGSSSETGIRPLKDEVLDRSGAVKVDGTSDGARNEGEQLEEVFGAVKAELAAGRGGAIRTATMHQAADGEPAPIGGPASSLHASRISLLEVRFYTLGCTASDVK